MDNFEKLFYWHGIASNYYNYKGDNVEVPFDNKMRILSAMGVDTSDPAATAEHAFLLDVAPWQRWLPSFNLVYLAERQSFFVNVPPLQLDVPFEYSLLHQDSPLVSGRFVPNDCPEIGDYVFEGVRYSRRSVTIDSVCIGYHSLRVTCGEVSESSLLVVVPSKAYLPPSLEEGRRPWGLILQLYTLRSSRNWGIGDLTDLAFVLRSSAARGVGLVGLNPLHALINPVADNCSPYSPSDRRFINPLYIDLEAEPEFDFDISGLTSELEHVRSSEKVLYAEVAALKNAYFPRMFSSFCKTELDVVSERGAAFLQFVVDEGAALEDYCLFQLSAELNIPYPPASLHDREVRLVEHAADLLYFAYLQWVARSQLHNCQALALSCGMDLGLMRDLAVGANGGGSEVCTNLDIFCRDAAVGAPPDPIAEKGQNWGLPPMDPARLRLTNFKHFIELLRSNMAQCGALRIDHAMSMLRLWWCPPGKTADFGAYVYYPFHELLGLLKLESVLNKCVIVGEDMGVVPPELRSAFYDGNIFTNKLFYFEKGYDGQFKHPNDYEPHSLAMLTNHDVPTFASWWSGSDLDLRRDLNLFDDDVDFPGILAQRTHEKRQLLQWLQQLGISVGGDFDDLIEAPLSHNLCGAILRGAAMCRSQLFVVQLEDLELMETPVNVPGTSFQYPNWQRKLNVSIETLFADQNVAELMAEIQRTRQG